MVVIKNRISSAFIFVRVFLFRLSVKNSLIFYSFLALWFNISPLYFKFLAFINNEFNISAIKAPSSYFLIVFSKSPVFSSTLSLPEQIKKHFLFGCHSLCFSCFDLFKLFFWSANGFWWVGFRKQFTTFSFVLLLNGKVAEWLKASAF